jgi:hypothetical protein
MATVCSGATDRTPPESLEETPKQVPALRHKYRKRYGKAASIRRGEVMAVASSEP